MFYKVGLVLSGGGGKGAYEVGVWKALREFGIDRNIQAVAGTSVGALNAAIFLQGDLELAERNWLSISQDKILSIDSGNIIDRLKELKISGRVSLVKIRKWAKNIAKYSIYSRSGLIDIINNNLDLSLISSSPIPCFVTACKLPSLEANYFPLNGCSRERIVSLLLASSAIPGIFPSEEIEGEMYVDGGVVDNIPVKPLYDMGCDLIIVVHLDRTNYIDHSQFPDAKILEIIPQEDQGGFIRGTLNFTPENAKRRIDQGYEDAKRLLQPIYEMINKFYDFIQYMEKLRYEELSFRKLKRETLYKRLNINFILGD